MPPCGIVGRIVFSLCPFPVESTEVYHIWCKSVQPFDNFPRLLNLWPPKPPPPQCRRGVSWGELFLAYVHSQMNPQTCTEFGPNLSIRLAAFPDLILWPPKATPPEMPPVVLRGELYLAMSIPRRIRRHVPNLVPVGWAVWQLPNTFEFVTP